MVQLKRSSTFWALFSLFVWLHALPGAFGPQLNGLEEIHDENVFSFSPNVYSDRDFAKGLTVIEFEENYISSAIFIWLWICVTLILGIYSSWLIFRDSKYWPYLVLFVTGVTCIKVIPDLIALINLSPSVIDHFITVGNIFAKRLRDGEGFSGLFYHWLIFVWPYFCLILFCYSAFELVIRYKRMRMSPNERMQSDPAELGR